MSLKKACETLESAFAETEAKLDKVSEKVDETLAQADPKSNGPTHLVTKLSAIKAEQKAIAKQIEELKETQNTFVNDILQELSKLEEAESQLLSKVGGEAALKEK